MIHVHAYGCGWPRPATCYHEHIQWETGVVQALAAALVFVWSSYGSCLWIKPLFVTFLTLAILQLSSFTQPQHAVWVCCQRFEQGNKSVCET
jgi:hypothetical protein